MTARTMVSKEQSKVERTSIGKHRLCADSLFKISVKTGRLACQADPDYKLHQEARKEATISRFFAFVRWAAKEGRPILKQPHPEGWKDFLIIQIAIRIGIDELWENLWDEKYRDRLGEAWEGEDFDLMAVWRKKAMETIKNCRQEAVLEMTTDFYVAKLMEAGATQEHAVHLADGLSEVILDGDRG